ncbi:MAG TPA: YceI family protein [Gemmatimonadales bacterium]
MLKQMLLAMMLPAGMVATLPTPAPSAREVRLEVASTGNEARYRVREQLAGFDLPNDAIGRSSGVSGALVLDEKGGVVPGPSRIVVNVAELRSDRDRRDGYVRRRILESDSFPTATLAPTVIRGLPWPLPASGQAPLTLAGDLTVKGVTRPTTWNVTANFVGDTISGTAATAFTFADFGLDQPRVPIVLSVGDTIRLEYDFRLVRTPASSSP